LDLKQTQIENLVVEYFQQRADTEVTLDRGGLYQVVLKSDVAQTDFGGRRQFGLIFDSELAYENPERELITANHPFLDIIRNDLERDPQADPHLGEAHLLAQLLSPEGQVAVPHLNFSSNAQRVEYQTSYRPTFILTYRVIYETDERYESLIHLCYDAATGSPQPELLPLLSKVFPLEGAPSGVHVASNLNLARVLTVGRKEIEARVATNSQIMGGQMTALLESEKNRLREHYQSQIAHISPRDIVSREQLKDTLEKDIADLEHKLTCHVRVQLLSVLRLWWPFVEYKATFAGNQSSFAIDGIRYSSQTGQTSFFRCEKCGNQTRYDICVVEQHALCGGRCSQGLTECATCHDVYCTEHGGACSDCSAPVCSHDRRRCSYGKHKEKEYYCPNCLVESFEGRLLCKQCAQYCDKCHRAFPHGKMAVCRIGHEHVCLGHGYKPDGFTCEDCGQTTCAEHGVRTSDGKWACQDHVRTATCCHKTYLRSVIVKCSVDAGEWLCPDHSVTCMDCGQAVCEKHSSKLARHRGKFVCANCRATCDLCTAEHLERSYLKRDLAVCATCRTAVCPDHREVCAVCKQVVCKQHLRVSSVGGQYLCPEHAQVASCCQRTFIKSQLLPCGDNRNEALCPEHRVTCLSCGAAVCETHRSGLHSYPGQFTCQRCARVCSSCPPGRNHLERDLAACQICNKSTCAEHRYVCVVGGEVVCRNDVRASVNREPLCPNHAGVCVQCGPERLHRVDQLRGCVVCRSNVCQADSSACQICGSSYICNAHNKTLPSCASCGRASCGARGCRPDSRACQRCGMRYCFHCVGRNGLCQACEALRHTTPQAVDARWLEVFKSASSSNAIPAATAQILRSILESPEQLSLSVASTPNRGLLVATVRYTPRWFQVLTRSNQQVLLVIRNTGQVVSAREENVDS
jgi:hypothetical protein